MSSRAPMPSGLRPLAALTLTLLSLSWSTPASAGLDLSGPVKMVENLVDRVRTLAGHPNPVKGASEASRPGQVPGTPLDPGHNPSTAPGSGRAEAAADSAESAALDNILLSPDPYHYEAGGRRDPFISLASKDDGTDTSGDTSGSDQLSVVGILWGDNDRFALVENGAGNSFILRQGDRCGRYTVTRIDPDRITIYGSLYGVGKSQTLILTDQKGSKHERRSS